MSIFLYKKVLICFSLISLILANFEIPLNDDTMNFTHILFEWEQERGEISSYNLKVYNNGEEVQNIIDSSLATIIYDFDWGEDYLIKLRTINENGEYSNWLDSLQLSIINLNNEWYNPEILIDNLGYQEGYTIIKERIIDRSGNIIFIWPYNTELFCITSILDNGQFIGFQSGSGTTNNNGIRSDLRGNIYWYSPERVIRELLPITLNNEPHYIGLVKESYTNTLPQWPGNIEWIEAGIDSVSWFSDQIVIWDESGNDIWRWSSKENYSFEDVDPDFTEYLYGQTSPNVNMMFDWTHANSVYYDESDSSVYINSRHLSRITKIDYPSGNIVWNLGKDLPSSDPVFGQNIDISGQHAIRKLDNGNFMVYDNGNFKDPELSRGLEISIIESDPPEAEIVWEYTLIDSLYTYKHGDCDRLKNGNSLLTAGQQHTLVEVDSLNNIVWAAKVDQQYRALRIPGLYPLVFSVKAPNLSTAEDLIYVPIGDSEFYFTIFNEGYLDYDFEYNIYDELGWFNSNNIISIPSEESSLIEISGQVNESLLSNLLVLEVCPISIYGVECKEFEISIFSCSTINEISNTCYEYIIGDINEDGLVNILDIVQLVNIVLLNEFQSSADLNSDNIINILDIVQLVNIILS